MSLKVRSDEFKRFSEPRGHPPLTLSFPSPGRNWLRCVLGFSTPPLAPTRFFFVYRNEILIGIGSDPQNSEMSFRVEPARFAVEVRVFSEPMGPKQQSLQV